MNQKAIPAVCRGRTSTGFWQQDLPSEEYWLLLRIVGIYDPFAKQIVGMGVASSSTGKIVVVSQSEGPDSHACFVFGAVGITVALIGYSGQCGDLATAAAVILMPVRT